MLKYIANALGKTMQTASNKTVSIRFDRPMVSSESGILMSEFYRKAHRRSVGDVPRFSIGL